VTQAVAKSPGRVAAPGWDRQFEVEVTAPFRLDLTVWALRRRVHNAIDNWDGTSYGRTVVLSGQPVEIHIRQVAAGSKARLVVKLRGTCKTPGRGVNADVRRLIERTLGLGVDLGEFYLLAEQDSRLAELAAKFAGVRPPRFPSVFEAVANAIACQQLSLTVGIHLLNRLSARYGPVVPGGANVTGFPSPEVLAGADPEELRGLGFSWAKAATLTGLARLVAEGELDLDALEGMDDQAAVATLVSLPGIGRWSAEYTLLRGLGRWQVLPGDDVGARNNLRRRFGLAAGAGYNEVTRLSRSWWPYGGLVYFHLLLESLAASGLLASQLLP
jgi:DNA-3-methyladenine glycosylase II